MFESVRVPFTNKDIAVLNITGSRREFALCRFKFSSLNKLTVIVIFLKGTIDPTKRETDKFSPLNPTSADEQHVALTDLVMVYFLQSSLKQDFP